MLPFFCLSALVLFAYCRTVFSTAVALLACGLFGLSTGLPFVGLHANTEAFMVIWLVGSLLSATHAFRTGKPLWFLLSGLLIGGAIMTKQVAIWNLVIFAAAAAWWGWRLDESPLRRAAPAAAIVAGGLIPVCIAAVPFLLTGSLGDFLYANFWYNYRYVGLLSSVERAFIVQRSVLFSLFFLALAGPWILGSLLGLLRLLSGPKPGDRVILILFAMASALGVATGGRFYPHYFLQLMPAMAILTALALSDINHRWRSGSGRGIAAAAFGLVIVSLITNGLLYFARDVTVERFSQALISRKSGRKIAGTWATTSLS
jgi:4-amino-4-deoxy-L-arabinose transferase-like glycosyltransferase